MVNFTYHYGFDHQTLMLLLVRWCWCHQSRKGRRQNMAWDRRVLEECVGLQGIHRICIIAYDNLAAITIVLVLPTGLTLAYSWTGINWMVHWIVLRICTTLLSFVLPARCCYLEVTVTTQLVFATMVSSTWSGLTKVLGGAALQTQKCLSSFANTSHTKVLECWSGEKFYIL